MLTAVLVIAHGSRLKAANEDLYGVVRWLRATDRWDVVGPCFLQFEEPNLGQAVEQVISQGAKRMVLVPFLLFPGNHMQRDIPEEVEALRKRYPHVEILLTRHLGIDERLAQMVIERIESTLGRSGDETIQPAKALRPDEIEGESFRIIETLLDLSPFPESFRPVVKRVVHTTGDVDFAGTLVFHPEAVSAGIEAIKRGRNILTDVNMVKTGIDKKLLTSFGGKVICRVASPSVREKAREEGKTRASTAIRVSAPALTGGIVAIGNAPTALMETLKLVQEGKARPALIVGIPVGFVGAAESKSELEKQAIPYITNRGTKGGSAVAAAIVNALLRMA
jgi:precorrin-8X/cobalt-precorrin-8 methylmutase